jgi:hypothetical protein
MSRALEIKFNLSPRVTKYAGLPLTHTYYWY